MLGNYFAVDLHYQYIVGIINTKIAMARKPLISPLGRPRQRDLELEASLGYTVKSLFQNPQNKYTYNFCVKKNWLKIRCKNKYHLI